MKRRACDTFVISSCRQAQLRCLKRERTRRGGVLFEAMLAIALFVGAASFTLASVRNVTRALERSRMLQEAVDIARSRMAELEAGLITLGALRGETDVGDGYEQRSGAFTLDNEGFSMSRPRWRLEIATSRTTFPNLTLVELTVIENRDEAGQGAADAANAMRYTLRQLVALRDDESEAFEEDPMLRGSGSGIGGGRR